MVARLNMRVYHTTTFDTNSDPTRYQNNSSKVAYAASYLFGSAKDWFQLHINEHTGTIDFNTCADFVSNLQAAFVDPDVRATAKRKLKALKQGPKDCSHLPCRIYYISIHSGMG